MLLQLYNGMMLGAFVSVFLLAALVESFIRESALDTPTRLALAALFAIGLAGGLWLPIGSLGA